jgi:hypothetical protein
VITELTPKTNPGEIVVRFGMRDTRQHAPSHVDVVLKIARKKTRVCKRFKAPSGRKRYAGKPFFKIGAKAISRPVAALTITGRI